MFVEPGSSDDSWMNLPLDFIDNLVGILGWGKYVDEGTVDNSLGRGVGLVSSHVGCANHTGKRRYFQYMFS